MVDRRGRIGNSRRYPRTARINEVLREVIAEELERLADEDPRLDLLTVTHVEAEPDLRHATVLLASLPDEAVTGCDCRPPSAGRCA
jgi:ribosome-binding factor A